MPARKKSKAASIQWIINFIVVLVMIITSCFVYFVNTKQPKNLLQPKNQISQQINLPGVYQGDLPCADCPGIKESLNLTATDSAQTSGSYLLEDLYLERNTKPFQTRGLWEVVNINILKLLPQTNSYHPQYFQVLENGNLQMLDSDMQKIDSPFNQILTKQ